MVKRRTSWPAAATPRASASTACSMPPYRVGGMGAHGGAMMAIRTGIDSTTSGAGGRTSPPGYRGRVGFTTPPAAPWELAGECVVAAGPAARGSRPPLPAGLHPMPGPLVVAAARFTESPVGPYLELSVAEPARLGARIGLCVTLMVVDSPDSRLGGRLNWGLPKELGTLRWLADDDERTLAWEDRDVVVRGVPSGPSVPMVAPVRSLQRRADGLVVVGGRMRGHARPARVEITRPRRRRAGRPGRLATGGWSCRACAW